MTPAAVVLFVFVTHGVAQGPSGDVVAACLRALPAGVRPVSRTVAEAPPDAAVQADAAAAGAAAAVVVSWTGADLLSADVRAAVGLPDRPRWVIRRVTFGTGDQVPERARALGLVIASMVEESFESPPAPTPSAPPPPVARAAPPPASEPAASVQAPPFETTEPGERPRWAIDAMVATALERGTDGDDIIGGAIGLRRVLPFDLALRAGAAFRFTERDHPDITTRALGGSLGLAWAAPSFGRVRRFGLGARADGLLMRQSVRVSQDQAPAAGDRDYWSAGVDALAEVGLGLSPGTTLLAAAGLEELFTEAEVTVPGRFDTTLPRTRILLQVGVLSRF